MLSMSESTEGPMVPGLDKINCKNTLDLGSNGGTSSNHADHGHLAVEVERTFQVLHCHGYGLPVMFYNLYGLVNKRGLDL